MNRETIFGESAPARAASHAAVRTFTKKFEIMNV